ncbi:MAG: PD-(D/E)XK nuclease family protein [Bacteroidales bacterium]|nr:PD-(D/E)XK nuclease family protein [Bacteroidales bacterium]
MDKEQPISVNQPKRTGIVLNRMYTGSYLSSNLGHEVINMFQADNGKHYLYLNDKGNFDKKYTESIDDMLLVRYVGENKVEILAWASGLTSIPGTNMPYSNFDPDSTIRGYQEKIIYDKQRKPNLEISDNWKDEVDSETGITYGEANLIDIFGDADQQNIYITYRAGKFQTPSARLFLEFGNEDNFWLPSNDNSKCDDNTFYLPGYLFGKMTLHQFIDNEPYTINSTSWRSLVNDLETIKTLIDLESKKNDYKNKKLRYNKLQYILSSSEGNAASYDGVKTKIEADIKKKREDSHKKLKEWLKSKDWIASGKTISKSDLKESKSRKISLFDIVPKLQRDENCFSDILKHFMDRDKGEWQKIFEKLCDDPNIGKVCSIEREKDATVGKKKNGNNSDSNGGRIDLLIRTEKAYIVIENKIKSDINSKESDGVDANQLKRYRDYVKFCIIGDYITTLTDEDVKKKLSESYKALTPSQLETFENEVKAEYDKLNKTLPEIKSYFFVLAPDYNMPSKERLKQYKALRYSILVGKNKDGNDKDVVKLMKDYNNEHQSDDLWSAFYTAMDRHSYDYENESLYEDMKNTFLARIQKCPKVKVSSNLDPNA